MVNLNDDNYLEVIAMGGQLSIDMNIMIITSVNIYHDKWNKIPVMVMKIMAVPDREVTNTSKSIIHEVFYHEQARNDIIQDRESVLLIKKKIDDERRSR